MKNNKDTKKDECNNCASRMFCFKMDLGDVCPKKPAPNLLAENQHPEFNIEGTLSGRFPAKEGKLPTVYELTPFGTEDRLSPTGRKISDPEPPYPLCKAGHKPILRPVSHSDHLNNYLSQVNYAELEQRVMAGMIADFNNSPLKSHIKTFQDELSFEVAEGEKDRVVELLKVLGFYSAEDFVNAYCKITKKDDNNNDR